MKNLFLIITVITITLLFTQCKKTEILTDEVIQTTKSNGVDILNNTQWEVVSVVSTLNNINLTWSIKFPKFRFQNGIVEMKLGRDICTKEYLCRETKFIAEYSINCQISNANHNTLANLFSGEFQISFSAINPNEIYLKSYDEIVFTLRRINTLTTNTIQ